MFSLNRFSLSSVFITGATSTQWLLMLVCWWHPTWFYLLMMLFHLHFHLTHFFFILSIFVIFKNFTSISFLVSSSMVLTSTSTFPIISYMLMTFFSGSWIDLLTSSTCLLISSLTWLIAFRSKLMNSSPDTLPMLVSLDIWETLEKNEVNFSKFNVCFWKCWYKMKPVISQYISYMSSVTWFSKVTEVLI